MHQPFLGVPDQPCVQRNAQPANVTAYSSSWPSLPGTSTTPCTASVSACAPPHPITSKLPPSSLHVCCEGAFADREDRRQTLAVSTDFSKAVGIRKSVRFGAVAFEAEHLKLNSCRFFFRYIILAPYAVINSLHSRILRKGLSRAAFKSKNKTDQNALSSSALQLAWIWFGNCPKHVVNSS